MKKLLLIQPGAFGDIFLCAPIAKWYFDRGWEISWPITKKFLSTISYFDYVKPIILSDEVLDRSDWLRSDVQKILPYVSQYDKVVNLADRGPHMTAQLPWEKFDETKYRLSEVPIEEKRNLVWKRNYEKENSLYSFVNPKKPYTIASLISSHGDRAIVPNHYTTNLIEVTQIEGYNIQDWYKLIENSSTIFSVESAVQCFIEGCGDKLNQDKFLLKRSSIIDGATYTYSPSWSTRYFK